MDSPKSKRLRQSPAAPTGATFRTAQIFETSQRVRFVNDLRTVVGRRAARGILIDDDGRLVLIKRTKPGQEPYWTAPGGGVEPEDASVEHALRRELAEELGATAEGYQQVYLHSTPSQDGVAIQHFLVARLTSLDLALRYGSEFTKPERGGYDLDRISLHGDDVEQIDLKPEALKTFVLANREALLAEAGHAG